MAKCERIPPPMYEPKYVLTLDQQEFNRLFRLLGTQGPGPYTLIYDVMWDAAIEGHE